jgi:hypothetical protein
MRYTEHDWILQADEGKNAVGFFGSGDKSKVKAHVRPRHLGTRHLAGRPLYETVGFQQTNEMMLKLR